MHYWTDDSKNKVLLSLSIFLCVCVLSFLFFVEFPIRLESISKRKRRTRKEDSNQTHIYICCLSGSFSSSSYHCLISLINKLKMDMTELNRAENEVLIFLFSRLYLFVCVASNNIDKNPSKKYPRDEKWFAVSLTHNHFFGFFSDSNGWALICNTGRYE